LYLGRFYSTTPHDKGTLFQLKQVINRTSFGKIPKHNMKAAEDFLHVVAGHNIPVDLHLEHLNRRLKGMLHGLGLNITPESVQRISKALGMIEAVCTDFEDVSNITSVKDYHSTPSFEKDLQKLQEQLMAQEVFVIKQGQCHQRFCKHKQLMSSIDWKTS